jgi:large subunit ribosomal protein L5
MARLLERYRNEIVPELKKQLGKDNPLALPRVEKVTISMGVGKAIENKNRLDAAARDLGQIAGQKPSLTRARKSVANFKLRKGQQIGVKVTLRGARAYEFLDRLISIVIPRIRDFRGLSPRAFDEAGNYNLGISEQVVFPEINLDKVEFVQGMNITIGVRARKQADSFELLKRLGVPFRTAETEEKRSARMSAPAASMETGTPAAGA